MKTIGLIGGMSWESTVTYYQIINTVVKEQLGGFHSAQCLLYSVDFHEIEECQSNGDWEKGAAILADAARRLERGGADFIAICTNTMHKVADSVQEAVSIPLLHIADATVQELQKNHIATAALLGTQYTMEQDFYKSKLHQAGLKVIVPEEDDRKTINYIIYNELCSGIIKENSRQSVLRIISELAEEGAQGIILGCTEIGLLVHQKDTAVPLFDTALIHAQRAALYALDRSI
ncbi:MAG: aspartate/glutamate racemase family protein [Syntrophomonadaceae bacterium]|nr:aspartate/glutamate racemase family protein [Bacillota bacterium]NLP25023.1 aspartate/glutamate racemase family protein [Syntrophomonadaceae bacterium]